MGILVRAKVTATATTPRVRKSVEPTSGSELLGAADRVEGLHDEDGKRTSCCLHSG